MKVFAIVPVKRFENAKTRLSSILSHDDRISLASIMLDETLQILSNTTCIQKVIVVSSDDRARKIASSHGCDFLREVKDNGVNSAVGLADNYSMTHHADASIVVPQDLPLLHHLEISKVCGLAENEKKCIVICPSQRYDGTNVLLRKPPDVIPTFYDSNSYESHISAARDIRLQTKVYLSRKLMLDIDVPEDMQLLERENITDESKVLNFIKQRGTKPSA